MVIKVCGMRDPDNIHEVARTGVTWMGMIFWDKSSRNVNMPEIAANAIPEGISRVGVFVDEKPERMALIARHCHLNVIQMHGSETPEILRQTRQMTNAGVKLMKAISIAGNNDILLADTYASTADLLLFDTKCVSVGGSGRQFDWNILDGYHGTLPFLLSGGIGPDDIERLSQFSHPKMIGIDLNSRFEISPGRKNPTLLKNFIERYKEV